MRQVVGLSPHVLTKRPGILAALDFLRYQMILKALLEEWPDLADPQHSSSPKEGKY